MNRMNPGDLEDQQNPEQIEDFEVRGSPEMLRRSRKTRYDSSYWNVSFANASQTHQGGIRRYLRRFSRSSCNSDVLHYYELLFRAFSTHPGASQPVLRSLWVFNLGTVL